MTLPLRHTLRYCLLSLCLISPAIAAASPPNLRAHLNAAAYAALDQHFNTRLSDARHSLAQHRALWRALQSLANSTPVSADPFDRWVEKSHSGASRLVRAEFYLRRAWNARGAAFVRDTHPDNFARMHELLDRALVDYKAAIALLGPACDVCQAGILEVHMLRGERSAGAAGVDPAMQALGGGMATPLNYLLFLHPRWGGSWEDMERFVQRFSEDFPRAPGVPLLRGALLAHQADAWLGAAEPERARLLLEQALRLDPDSAYLWQRLAATALLAGDAEGVLRASEKALSSDPNAVEALNARASVLLRGPQALEAVPLLERSVALGDDWALQTLLPIVAAGQHGFRPDRDRAQALCQSAIDALRPAGFACMGGLHFFGLGRAPDKALAFQWFAEAAERGVASSMVDAGLMLWRGDGVPRDAERAIVYWLRAHAAGEPRADGQLRAQLSAWAYWQRVTLPGYWSATLRGWQRIQGWLQAASNAL